MGRVDERFLVVGTPGQVDLKLDFTDWPIIPCEFQSGTVRLFNIVLSDQPVLKDSDIFEATCRPSRFWVRTGCASCATPRRRRSAACHRAKQCSRLFLLPTLWVFLCRAAQHSMRCVFVRFGLVRWQSLVLFNAKHMAA